MRNVPLNIHFDSRVFLTNEQECMDDSKLKDLIAEKLKDAHVLVHRIDRDGVGHASNIIIDVIIAR
jgi:hypothetical protein